MPKLNSDRSSPKSLIVFTHGGGRMGNQLTNHTHLLAFWREHNGRCDVTNFAFHDYAPLFEKTRRNPWGDLPEGHGRLRGLIWIYSRLVISRPESALSRHTLRLLHGCAHALPSAQSIKVGVPPNHAMRLPGRSMPSMNLGDPATVGGMLRKRVTLLAGWPIRNWDLVVKHAGAIRASLSVATQYQSVADSYINRLRQGCDVLVGVLVRRNDYRKWAEGRFFFELPNYARWIAEMRLSLAPQRVAFVVASDEPIAISALGGANVHPATGRMVGEGHFIESFAELAACDYVMAPPSTFSAWAAFAGNAKMIVLENTRQVIRREAAIAEGIGALATNASLSIALK